MSGRAVVLFAVHYASDEILAEYAALRAAAGPALDVVLHYDNLRGDVNEALPAGVPDVHTVDAERIRALGFPSWPDRTGHFGPESLLPGNWDFAVVDFYRAHPEYDFYWRIEFDVRFSGPWSRFFGPWASSRVDLLTTTVQRREDGVPWFWWASLGGPGLSLDPRTHVRAFLPVCRISRRACELMDRSYGEGVHGHVECVVPTLLAQRGMEIEDLGGSGEFVRPENENRFYVNEPTDDCLRPGTFIFRPAREAAGDEPDKLWHPVKDEVAESRWLRRLADRGEPVAQYRLGVQYNYGRGVPTDLVEAYVWHALAVAGGHEPALKWRDDISAILAVDERERADARIREWRPATQPEPDRSMGGS
jgi:hypothetical protein